jgi:exodeoxyribonuclease VII large subunit
VLQRSDGAVVRSAAEVTPGERLLVRLAEGELRVTVDDGPDSGRD